MPDNPYDDPWHLSKAQEEEAIGVMDALTAVKMFHLPLAAYKGKLDGEEVIVFGVQKPQDNGLMGAVPLFFTSKPIIRRIECEGGVPR